MGWITRFILRLSSPEKRQAMEDESKLWMVQCPHCSYERSIGDMGGIRYKAAGKPRRYIYCSECGKRGWHKTYKRSEN